MTEQAVTLSFAGTWYSLHIDLFFDIMHSYMEKVIQKPNWTY